MALLRAGRLDKRAAIFRHTVIRNEAGDDVDGFLPPIEVWASVRQVAGSETLQDAQDTASARVTFWIRWRAEFDPNVAAGLSPKDRVQYPPGTGRIFDIVSVSEIGRREGIELAGVTRAG